MENRVLLAFVLSLVVFVGWGYFLEEVQGPPPEKIAVSQKQAGKVRPTQPLTQSGGESVAPQGSVLNKSQGALPVPAQVQFPGTEVVVKVSTGQAEMEFSSQGGNAPENSFA